jgi:hypothetical protein
LPHFMVVDAAGNTLDIQSFKGKKLFVNLWATWCCLSIIRQASYRSCLR